MINHINFEGVFNNGSGKMFLVLSKNDGNEYCIPISNDGSLEFNDSHFKEFFEIKDLS